MERLDIIDMSTDTVLGMSYKDILELGRGINLKMEDTTVKMTPRSLLINRIIWDNSIRVKGVELPMTSKYIIQNHYSDGVYFDGSIKNLLTVIRKDQVKLMNYSNRSSYMDILDRGAFKINEDVYNILLLDSQQYMRGINSEDIYEITSAKIVKESIIEAKNLMTTTSIENVYTVIREFLKNGVSKSNNVYKAYTSNTINERQLLQIIGPRGFVAELDGNIFKYPILSGFGMGMQSLYDYTVESRTGTKASFESTTSIKSSEWFGREMQMIALSVERVIQTDCGNRIGLPKFIRGILKNNLGDITYDGDVRNMVGKKYKENANDTTWKTISKEDTHLFNTTIYLRSVRNCKLNNKHHVCSECVGDIAVSINKEYNIGNLLSTSLSAILSQLILSTKHNIVSSVSLDITLSKLAARVFKVGEKGYFLNPEIFEGVTKVEMLVKADDFKGYNTVMSVDKTHTLNTTKVSYISTVQILLYKNGGVESIPVKVKNGDKFGLFTHGFLNYIKKGNIRLNESLEFIIDLTRWTNPDLMVIRLPDREYSNSQLMKSVKEMLFRGSMPKKLVTDTELMTELFELVNSKLSVNWAVIELIVYAFTAKDFMAGDYDLSRGGDPDKLFVIKLKDLVRRSAGLANGMSAVNGTFHDPGSFLNKNTSSHGLDSLFFKEEYIKNKGS